MSKNQIWNELTLDALLAASVGMAVKDFEIQCRLKPMQNGKSFFDRVRVAEDLMRQGLIEAEDGYLKISMKELPTSILSELKVGSELAWEIIDYLDQKKRFTQKIDLELLHQIGLEGELAVIKELHNLIPENQWSRIKHISIFDDSAGFDIQAPSIRNIESTILFEIKTSPRPGNNFTFYISQNEARVASLNHNWVLLAVISTENGYNTLGYLNYYQFSDILPKNEDDKCRWETARVTIPKHVFKSGFP
jgi:hypothetical protein